MKALGALLATVLALALSSGNSLADIPAEQKNRVLILNSYHLSYSWSDEEMSGILATLKEEMPALEPMIEYLDCKYFPGMEHFPRLASLFSYKFKNINIPVVIAADNPALDFALQYRAELFPESGAPGLEPQQVVWWPPGGDGSCQWIALVYQGNLWLVDSSSGAARQVTGDGLVSRIDWR